MKAESAQPHIVLAPMEGVVNAERREMLTAYGGYTRCVTEFVRVSDALLPERVFRRYCPELATGGRTGAGVPVYIQLLGSDFALMAANARRAAAMGAVGIDLNFGCPARTVNRSDGGAALLRQPQRVADVVAAVREAVPADIPVTAKIRLGFDHDDDLHRIAEGIARAGAAELCIHARTRTDGYRPPAYWSRAGDVTARLALPVLINGEIWTPADYRLAIQQAGTPHVMLGRGALARPDLARRCRAMVSGRLLPPALWPEIAVDLLEQFDRTDCQVQKRIGNRSKQWLAWLQRAYPEADRLFREIRCYRDRQLIRDAIVASMSGSAPEPGADDPTTAGSVSELTAADETAAS